MDKEPVKISESYVSMALGAIVVLVIGILIFNYFSKINKSASKTQVTSTPSAQEVQKNPDSTSKPLTVAQKPVSLPTTSSEQTYTVVKGDNLWKVSEKFYGTGNNWKLIATENKLINPRVIHPGNVLRIPNATIATLPATGISGTTAVTSSTISGGSYTISKGDTLWSIAVRAYADGFQWTKISKANNNLNPRGIRTGMTIILPR